MHTGILFFRSILFLHRTSRSFLLRHNLTPGSRFFPGFLRSNFLR
jgi:hypothetical protein